MSPRCPGSGHTFTGAQHGGWSPTRYPPIIRQGILLSLVLPICLKELLSVCFQGEPISQAVLRARDRRCYRARPKTRTNPDPVSPRWLQAIGICIFSEPCGSRARTLRGSPPSPSVSAQQPSAPVSPPEPHKPSLCGRPAEGAAAQEQRQGVSKWRM